MAQIIGPFPSSRPGLELEGDGTLTHGSTVTITGTGFGTKATAAPLVWDNCMHGQSFATRWDGGWPIGSTYNPQYQSVIRSQPMPHARTTKYITQCNYQNGNYETGWNAMFWKNFTFADPTYLFWSRRLRCDSAFDSGDNWKAWDYSYGGSPYSMSGDHSNWYLEEAGGLTAGPDISWHVNDDGPSLRPWSSDPDIYYGDRDGISGQATSPLGRWVQEEGIVKLTAATDGVIRVWQNGVLCFDYSVTNRADLDHWTDRMPDTARTVGFGGYTRNYNTNNWWYHTDIYFDLSWARVILGNATTLAASTIREAQAPTAWSATSITITLNLGAVTNGQTFYLHVVNSAGTVQNNVMGALVAGD